MVFKNRKIPKHLIIEEEYDIRRKSFFYIPEDYLYGHHQSMLQVDHCFKINGYMTPFSNQDGGIFDYVYSIEEVSC